MAASLVNVINQVDSIGTALEVSSDLDVEVTFILKKVSEVATAFFHEIGINSVFLKNGDQLLFLTPSQKRKPGQLGADNFDVDHRTCLGVDQDVRTIRFRVILSVVEAHHTCQPVLVCKIALHQSNSRLNSLLAVAFTGFQ